MTEEELPLVTVLIPARNEEADIEACLEAVLAQDYPHDRLEVIVVDGASTDRTAEIARQVLAATPLARCLVLAGPGATPANLNAGFTASGGMVLCRVDARSSIPTGYVRRCVEVLESRPDIVVVGGSQVAVARPDATKSERGIVRALRNPWATGFARYRRGGTSGPTETVYLGAFRTADLRAVSGWDERFLTNQDFELNTRLGRRGLVWFEANLAVGYRPRSALRSLWQQNRRFGRWKAAGWLEAGIPVAPRQILLLIGPPAASLGVAVLARRSPVAAVLTATVGLWALESRGGTGPTRDRIAAAAAILALSSGWWSGVMEQTVRRAGGQRLLVSSP